MLGAFLLPSFGQDLAASRARVGWHGTYLKLFLGLHFDWLDLISVQDSEKQFQTKQRGAAARGAAMGGLLGTPAEPGERVQITCT